MEQLKLTKDISKIHQMFGKKLYSSKYSFISEMCQNAVDSHRMAKVTRPIEVEIKNGKLFTFCVKDYGLSFTSKEDFIEKICTIAESGKPAEKTDDKDCPMGYHGIGSISVSAFNSEWKYTVINNGRKFTAILKEIEGKGLNYELSDYEQTEEEKSVLFEVVIPSTQSINEFIANLLAKTAYFKDIKFIFAKEITNSYPELLVINTTFKIFQAPDFQISTLNKISTLHISLDQYTYQINWHALGINHINFPFALKFSMGEGLSADMTRENLVIDENYKEIILNKIKKVADWLITEYNKQLIPTKDISKIMTLYGRDGYYDILDKTIYLGEIQSYSQFDMNKLTFDGVKPIVLQSFINNNWGKTSFKRDYHISRSGVKLKTNYDTSGWLSAADHTRFLYSNVSKIKLNYIKSKYKQSGIFYKKDIPLFTKTGLCYSRMIMSFPTKAIMKAHYLKTGENLWRTLINQYKILEDAVEKHYLMKMSDVEVPADFNPVKIKKVIHKEKVDITALTGDIYLGEAQKLYNDSSCKFVTKLVKVNTLPSIPIMVYGENAELLKRVFILTNYSLKNQVKVVLTSATSTKLLNKLNLSNCMEVGKYMKSDHESLRKFITAFYIHKFLVKEYHEILNDKRLSTICPTIAKDISVLLNYIQVNKFTNDLTNHLSYNDWLEDLLKIAQKENIFDDNSKELCDKVLADIHHFDFLPAVNNTKNTDKTIKDLLQYRKQLTWKNYSL